MEAPKGRFVLSYFNFGNGSRVIGRQTACLVALENGGFDYVIDHPVDYSVGPNTPLGTLPTLRFPGHDGAVISESGAIIRYAGKFGAKPLYPSDPAKAAIVDQMLETIEEAIVRWSFKSNPEQHVIDANAKYAAEAVPKYLAMFSKVLEHSQGPFVLGKEFSAADAAIVGYLNVIPMMKPVPADILSHYPKVQALVEAFNAHPTVQALVAKVNLIHPPKGLHTLTYFNVQGAGVACRIALSLTGFEWKNEFVTGANRAELKSKGPLGQFPLLTFPDGSNMCQSHAIARYIGKFGRKPLYPAAPDLALAVDDAMNILADIRPPQHPDPEKKKQLQEEYFISINGFAKYGNMLEQRIAAHGNGPFVLGSRLSLADLFVYQTINALKHYYGMSDASFKNCPLLIGVYQAVAGSSAIQATGQLSKTLYPPGGKYKLTYFGILGRAFAPAVALTNAGIDYDLVTVKGDEFKELKPSLPLGSLPVLTLPDGKMICQSKAIARYASNYGQAPLYPEDPMQRLIVDEVADSNEDIMSKAPQDADPEKKKQKREEWVNAPNGLHYMLSFLAKRYGDAGGPFLLGDKLSYADLFTYGTISMLKSGTFDYIPKDAIDGYPSLVALYQAVRAHPAVIASKQLDFEKA